LFSTSSAKPRVWRLKWMGLCTNSETIPYETRGATDGFGRKEWIRCEFLLKTLEEILMVW
jgi:hypothetical protein